MFQIRLVSLTTDRPSNNEDYRIMQRKCTLASTWDLTRRASTTFASF
jgi:uncharacterized protein (DUF736 family)